MTMKWLEAKFQVSVEEALFTEVFLACDTGSWTGVMNSWLNGCIQLSCFNFRLLKLYMLFH